MRVFGLTGLVSGLLCLSASGTLAAANLPGDKIPAEQDQPADQADQKDQTIRQLRRQIRDLDRAVRSLEFEVSDLRRRVETLSQHVEGARAIFQFIERDPRTRERGKLRSLFPEEVERGNYLD